MLNVIRYLLLRNGLREDLVGELNIGLDVSQQRMTKPGCKMLAYLLRGLAFHANVSGRIRSIADLNDCEAGIECRIALLYFYNLILDLLSYGSVREVIRNCFGMSRSLLLTLRLQFRLFYEPPLIQ